MIQSRLAPFILSTALAFTPHSQAEEVKQLDGKLERYHKILLKRPSSGPLFQNFQTHWLAEHDEKSLTAFLKNRAENGGAADQQIYAYLLLQKGQNKEALDAFSLSLKNKPENAQAWLDRARCYANLLDFDNAIKDIEKAIEHSTADELTLNANKLKGRFLIRSGNTDTAIAHWTKLAKEFKNDTDLIEDVIDIQLTDGLNDAALKLATELRDQTKDPYKRALRTLRVGDILQKVGQRKESIDTYLSALKASGTDSWLEREIIAQLEVIHQKEDDITGLTSLMKTLSDEHPQRTHLQRKYADLLAGQSDFEQAGSIYKALLKKNPADKPIRIAYLNLLKQSSNFKEASKLLDFLIEQNPNDAQLLLQKASIADEMDDRVTLLKNLNAYAAAVTKTPATALKFANLLSKYRFNTEAVAAYKKATADYPDSLEAAFACAAFLHRQKHAEEALTIWKSIADKADRDSLIRLLDTLIANNQKELAFELATKHHAAHKTSPSYLRTACSVAEQVDKLDQAISWSRDIILLAKKASELDSALSLATRLITKADAQDDVLAELTKKADIGVAETCLMAELKDATGNIEGANAILKQLLESKDPIALLQAARIYERRTQITLAAQALETLTAQPQGAKNIFLRRLTSLYERAGMLDKAMETVVRWKTISPNDKTAWLVETQLLEHSEGAEAALSNLRRGIERFNDDVEVLGRLAELYSAASRTHQSMQVYWRLYDDSKDLSERIRWASMLSTTAMEAGETDALIDELNNRRRRNPTSIAPLMALAEVHRNLDQYEERRNLLLEATRIRPDDAQILIEIASIDEREGKSTRAIEVLEKAQLKDKSGVAARRLAKLYIDEGDFDRGLEQLTKMANQGSGARNIESIVLPLVRQQAFEEAKAYLDKHIVDHNDDWRLLLISALVDFELGFTQSSFDSSLKLLTAEKDLGKLKHGWEVSQFNQGFAIMDFDKLPSKVQLMLAAPMANGSLNNITQQQQQNRYNFYPGSGMQSGSNLSNLLPKSIDGAKLMAHLHLVRLFEEVDGEQKTAFVTRAKQAGMSSPEAWEYLTVEVQHISQAKSSIAELLESHPDDPDVLMLYVASKLMSGEIILEESVIAKVREQFAVEKNVPAFSQFSPFFMGANEDKKKHTEKVFDLLDQRKRLYDTDLIGLILCNRHVFERMESGDKSQIDPRLITLLKRYLEENPAAAGAQPIFNYRSPSPSMIKYMLRLQASTIILQDLLTSDDFPAIVKAIEKDELRNIRSLNYGVNFGNHSRHSFAELTFPPRPLSHISLSQLSQFTSGSSPLDPETLKPHLGLFENTLLKLLATSFCGESDAIEGLLKQLAEDPKQRANSYYLEAAWIAKNDGEPAKIIELLEKARTHTFDKQQRNAIDSHLVGIVMNLSADEKAKVKDVIVHSQGAARRLMISRKITQADTIDTILKQLDMSSERDRFLTKNNTSIRQKKVVIGGLVGAHNSNNSRSSSRSSRPQGAREKLQKAIEKGDNRQATRIASSSIRGLLRTNSDSYKLRKIKELVSENDLTAGVLKQSHPGNSSSPRKWLAYYETAKLLEDAQGTKEALDFLSSLPSVPSSVRVPLSFALYESDKKRAMKLIKNQRSRGPIFTQLENKIDKHDSDPALYVPLLEFTAEFLNHQDFEKRPLSDSDLQPLQRLFNEVVGLGSRSSDSLPSYWKTPVKLKENKELIARRDKAIEPILKLCLTRQPVCTDAFKIMLERRAFREESNADMVAIARESILDTASNNTFYSGYSDQSTTYAKQPTPLEFLLKHALETDNADSIDQEIIKACSMTAPYIKELKELIFLDDKAFLKALVYDKKEHSFMRIGLLDYATELRGDKHRIEFCKATLPFFVSYITGKKAAENSWYQHMMKERAQKACLEALTLLLQNKQESVVSAAIDALAQSKGEEITVKQWMKYHPENYGSHQNENEPITILSHWMRAMLSQPASCHYALAKATELNCPVQLLRSSSNYNQALDTDGLLDQFKKANYLTSIDKLELIEIAPFDTKVLDSLDANTKRRFEYLLRDNSSSNSGTRTHFCLSMMTDSIYNLRHYDNHREAIEELHKHLAKDASFGAQVISVMLQRDSSDNVIKFLEKNKETITNAPSAKQQMLLALLDLENNKYVMRKMKSKGLDKLFPQDEETRKKKIKAKTDAYFKLAPADVKNNLYNLPDRTKEVLDFVLSSDPDLAAKVVLKYVELVEGNPVKSAQRFDSMKYTNYTYVHSALNDSFFKNEYSSNIDPFDHSRLVYRLHKSNRHLDLNTRQSINGVSPRNLIRDARESPKLKKIFRDQVQKMASLEDPDELDFHKAAWVSYIISPNAWSSKSDADWHARILRELASKEPKHADLYNYLATCMTFAKGKKDEYIYGGTVDLTYRGMYANKKHLQSVASQIVDHFEKADLKTSLLVQSFLDNQPVRRHSAKYRAWEIDLLCKAAEDPKLAASPYVRASLTPPSQVVFEETSAREERIVAAAEKILHAQLDLLDAKQAYHVNPFLNNCCALASTAEGTAILDKIVSQRPKHFLGHSTVAQLLIRHGYIDTAHKVLPSSKYIVFSADKRIAYDALTHQNLPKLLERYSDEKLKLIIAASLQLRKDPVRIDDTAERTYNQRLADIAQLAAKSKLSRADSNLKAIYEHLIESEYSPLVPVLAEEIKKRTHGSSFEQVIKKAEKNWGYEMDESLARMKFKLELHEMGPEAFAKRLRDICILVNETPTKRTGSYNNTPIEWAGEALYTTIVDYYALGEDEKVVPLLPLLREVQRIDAYAGKIPEAKKHHKRSAKYSVIRSTAVSAAIHEELGKGQDYTNWLNAQPAKVKQILSDQSRSRYMLAYSRYHAFGSKQYMNPVSLASQLPFIQRMLNNPTVQQAACSKLTKGGILNYMVIWRIFSSDQALDLYNHMEIDGSPEFLAMLERDKGILAANTNDKELSLGHFEKMAELFKQSTDFDHSNSVLAYIDAAQSYSDFGDKASILTLFPDEVVSDITGDELKRYESFMKSAIDAENAKQ